MKGTLAVVSICLLGACSSSTAIRVSDPDARIYVNDEYLGEGYARYRDRKPAFTEQRVTVRKDGCSDQHHSFRRNERPDIGAIVSAYYLWVPILWITQYKAKHVYEFDCVDGEVEVR